MDRSTLVKGLLVVAILIPIAIESVTFLGLFGQHFGSTDTTTPTETPDAIGVGDDLVADRENVTATVASGMIEAAEDHWLFRLNVTVSNRADVPVEVVLGPVQTGDSVRQETAATGRVPPGERRTLLAQWPLPSGETPTAMNVTTIRYAATTRASEKTVRIGGFPVQQ